ncbi:MAG: hypothetical protein IJT47_06180 [Selenomonadaceae bacterium]|nr:hypothetical protein [Selenomonadaceae bacterium]
MTEQEKINTELQTKLALQDAKFNVFMQEMRDFKTEMRQQNEIRAEDMREIRASIADMGKHVRNLSLTAMGAIGAMFDTVIISLLRN